MAEEFVFPRDRCGIAIWPEIAYLNSSSRLVAIRRFSPTRKYTVSLSMIHSYYVLQGLEIANSIQTIVFDHSVDKMRIAELLCRKASIAFGEASKVKLELERQNDEYNAQKKKKD